MSVVRGIIALRVFEVSLSLSRLNGRLKFRASTHAPRVHMQDPGIRAI